MDKSEVIYKNLIKKVANYILNNLHDSLNLEKMAHIANMSPYHFHRVFTQIKGETPYNFLKRCRIEKSAQLILSHKKMFFHEVAYECGFSSQSMLTRAFRKHYGTTPYEFRKRIKQYKMTHIELKGTHYEIGKQLGEFLKEQKTFFPIKLNTFQAKRGIESLKLMEKFSPEIIDEIKGITESLDYDYELFGAWLMSMGCSLTIRESHNVEIRGCTAFCFTNRGKVYYGRDNDLPPYLKSVSKSIYYKPIDKNHFLLNTSSFTNGEEGINEHGLVVAMTFVVPRREEVKTGINSVFLVRYLLENCRTVKESISALKILPIASSCNILLVDKTKAMSVVECSPFEINIRQPETNTKGEKFIVTVNHFTSSKMQKYDRSNQNVYSSRLRYKTAHNALFQASYSDPILYAKNILSGKLGFMCQYKNVKFETIWSTIFDIIDYRMFLAKGNPELEEYQDIKLQIGNHYER